MSISLGDYWLPTDLHTFITFPYTDRRDKIQVMKNSTEILATTNTSWESST